MSLHTGDMPLYRYRFGDAELDEARAELRVAGQPVALEPRPFALLLELLRHAGEVVTREELIESVWGGRPTVDNVLPNAASKLRKVLDTANAAALVSLPRVGYRLDAAVERTVVQPGRAAVAALAAGQAVPLRPDYRLQALLGNAHGSEVWLARQAGTAQLRVFKFSLDGRRLSALKREAALTRVLRESLGARADIAALVDWNFAEAPFHLELEYGGPDLLHWAEKDGRLAALPRAQRLALFLQIADAVAAAHGVGVLHKDLKPANVLVAAHPDGGWQARLTDFGSAGLLDPARLAELGITRLDLLATLDPGSGTSSGTPLYYAPELVAGQPPSVRSDLYALGILLYQLLAGDLRRPLASGWERGIDDPLLSAEIARATDGDPARRHASVAELAERLRTLEARRAEGTHRQALEERAQRAVQVEARVRARRPWVVATIAVLAVGLAAFAWQYRLALAAGAEAARQARHAETINAFLIEDLVNAGNPTLWGKRDPSLREVLDRARTGLDKRTDLDPQAAAAIHLALAHAFQAISDYPGAEAQYLKSIERGGAADGPSALQAQFQLARLLAVRGRPDEAGLRLQQALAKAGPLQRRTDAIAMYAHWAQASVLTLAQRLDEAAAAYEQALAAQARVAAGNPRARIRLLIEAADTYSRGNRMEDAERLLTDLLGPGNAGLIAASDQASAHLLLGRALVAGKRYAQAEPVLDQALAELTGVYGADSYFVSLAHSELAPLHWLTGRNASALQHAQQCYAGFVARLGGEHQVALMGLEVLASARFFAGEIARSADDYAKVQAGLEAQLGRDAPLVMGVGYRRAFALAELGRFDEAAQLLEGVDAAALDAATADPLWTPRVQGLRGLVLAGQGRTAESAALLAAAIPALEAGQEPQRYLRRLRLALYPTAEEGAGEE